jgi:hypothetical protein
MGSEHAAHERAEDSALLKPRLEPSFRQRFGQSVELTREQVGAASRTGSAGDSKSARAASRVTAAPLSCSAIRRPKSTPPYPDRGGRRFLDGDEIARSRRWVWPE